MAKPRIRSIKPEFWTDEEIAKLPKATALFFIALWNFADDQGIIEDSSQSLSLRIPIYRSQDIQKMLNALWRAGLILRSPGDGLVMIRGWAHQKIDRPRDGKWKGQNIQWLAFDDSTNGRDESPTGSDRIGSDRKGSEATPAPAAAGAAPVFALQVQDSEAEETAREGAPAQQFIGRYCELFKARYGTNPTIRGKQAGIAKRVLKDMPTERALLFLEAFFQMPDAWLVKTKHPLEAFETKLNEITVYANTGQFTSLLQSRQAEQKHATLSQLERVEKGLL